MSGRAGLTAVQVQDWVDAASGVDDAITQMYGSSSARQGEPDYAVVLQHVKPALDRFRQMAVSVRPALVRSGIGVAMLSISVKSVDDIEKKQAELAQNPSGKPEQRADGVRDICHATIVIEAVVADFVKPLNHFVPGRVVAGLRRAGRSAPEDWTGELWTRSLWAVKFSETRQGWRITTVARDAHGVFVNCFVRRV